MNEQNEARPPRGVLLKPYAIGWGIVLVVLPLAGWLGYQVRGDALGVLVAWFVACLPILLVTVGMGIVQVRREARSSARRELEG